MGRGRGRPPAAALAVTAPDVLIDTIRAIDEIFIRLAETQPLRQWVLMRAPPELDELPLDHVVEEMWTALALGYIRLTGAGKRLHVAPVVGTKGERQLLVRAHRPIIKARRRVLDEANLA
jgi:hypothetical protein